jgi:hypothetical protein
MDKVNLFNQEMILDYTKGILDNQWFLSAVELLTEFPYLVCFLNNE